MALTSFTCNLDCCIQTSIHMTHICSKAAGRHTSRHLLLKAWSLKHQQIWLVKCGMLLEEDQKLLTMRSMNWRLSTRVCDVLKRRWQMLVNWSDWIMICNSVWMNWDNWVLTFRIESNLFFLIWSEANMSGHVCRTEQAFYQLKSYTLVWQFRCLDKSMLIKHLEILCVYSCVTDIIKVFYGKTKSTNWKTSSQRRVSMLLWFMLWIA